MTNTLLVRRILPRIVWYCQFTFLVSNAIADVAPLVTIDTIVQSMRTREQRFPAATFEWTEERFVAKRSWRIPGRPVANLSPAEDLTLKSVRRFSFDGANTRCFEKEELPDESGQLIQLERVDTFDGEFSRMLEAPTQKRNFQYGRIYPRTQKNVRLNDLVLAPLLQCYRISTKGLISSDKCGILGREAMMNQTQAIIITDFGSLKQMFWLDPAREYRILRCVLQYSHDRIQRQTDFTYADGKAGSALKGWKIVKYDSKGNLTESITATVLNYDLSPTLSPADFKIEFPVGAYVDHLPDRTNYIQRENGKKRLVLPAENTATYEQLLATESGKALLP